MNHEFGSATVVLAIEVILPKVSVVVMVQPSMMAAMMSVVPAAIVAGLVTVLPAVVELVVTVLMAAVEIVVFGLGHKLLNA